MPTAPVIRDPIPLAQPVPTVETTNGSPSIREQLGRHWEDVLVLTSLVVSRLVWILAIGLAEGTVTWLLDRAETALGTGRFQWTTFVVQVCVIAFDIALLVQVIVKSSLDVFEAFHDARDRR